MELVVVRRLGPSDAAVRARLGRGCLVVGAGALGLALLGALAIAVPLRAQYAVLLVGGLVVGLPHGAVDWVALPLGRSGALTGRGIAVVGALYAGLGGLYLLVWILAPGLAAVAFLALTWLHWGQGDRYVLRSLYGAGYLRDRTQAALTVAVRGGFPMVLPLVAFPETYRDVLLTFVRPFGGELPAWWSLGSGPRLALGGIIGLLTVVTLWRARRLADDTAVWRLDTAETVGLWLFFLAVPPVLAIGVYFACWHSLRHIARVVLLDPDSRVSLAGGDLGPPIGRFVSAALPPTLLALAFVVVMLWSLPRVTAGLGGIAGVWLVGIAILTLPHVVVVSWLDWLPEPPAHTTGSR